MSAAIMQMDAESVWMAVQIDTQTASIPSTEPCKTRLLGACNFPCRHCVCVCGKIAVLKKTIFSTTFLPAVPAGLLFFPFFSSFFFLLKRCGVTFV